MGRRESRGREVDMGETRGEEANCLFRFIAVFHSTISVPVSDLTLSYQAQD